MIRRIFTTRDGRTIELEGAPGRRAIATYLHLAMDRHNVSRPEELGTELRDIPDTIQGYTTEVWIGSY